MLQMLRALLSAVLHAYAGTIIVMVTLLISTSSLTSANWWQHEEEEPDFEYDFGGLDDGIYSLKLRNSPRLFRISRHSLALILCYLFFVRQQSSIINTEQTRKEIKFWTERGYYSVYEWSRPTKGLHLRRPPPWALTVAGKMKSG